MAAPGLPTSPRASPKIECYPSLEGTAHLAPSPAWNASSAFPLQGGSLKRECYPGPEGTAPCACASEPYKLK